MNTAAILFTAGFDTAAMPLPRAANATLTRIAPAPRRIAGRLAVRWTVVLGDSARKAGLHARLA